MLSLIDKYLEFRQSKGLAIHTLRNNSSVLHMLLPKVKDLKQVTQQDIIEFISDKKLKSSTLENRHIVLKGFFQWMENDGYILVSPMKKLNVPKISKTLPKKVMTVCSLSMDFREFFPSIQPSDLFKVLKSKKELSKEDCTFLSNVLFLEDDGLAIGAPTSPIISNAVMNEFDTIVAGLCKGIDEDAAYTRYADDIVFSTNFKGVCQEFYTVISNFIEEWESPKLTINYKKTKFMSGKNKKLITGLIVCPDGSISIGRSQKRFIC